jgi:predicted phage terminase large subunit-like protein
LYEIDIEQEPGSGGKESAENTQGPGPLSLLRRQDYGSKEVRAERFAAQVQAGNVYLVAGGWHRDFVDELESFPYLACSTTSKSGLLD